MKRLNQAQTSILMAHDAILADITHLLSEAAGGDPAASGKVWSALYGELRRLARIKLDGERPDHTLSPTSLVHEAYLKLVDDATTSAANRNHFLALAARAMRQILVDHARRRARGKRGHGRPLLPLMEARDRPLHPDRDPDLLLALDEALVRLAAERERMAQVVELRFFGGLTPEETAQVLQVTRRTVERDWSLARAYLFRQLAADEAGPDP